MKEKNPFVAITAITAGIILVMVVLVLLINPAMMAMVSSPVWAVAVIGIVMGGMARKKK